MSGLFRDCAKCHLPVHVNSKACKSCGGPSPWATGTKEPEPTAEASEPTAALPSNITIEVAPGVDPKKLADDITRQTTTAIRFRAVEPPLDLNPADADVAAYIHKLTAPDAEQEAARVAEIEARNGPHVFLDRFSCMVGPTMAHFKAGDLVKDFALLQALRAENAPMVPAALAPGMTCCPKCQNVFRVPSIVPAKRAG